MSIIAMIKGKIQMVNGTRITNQPSFFASFESNVVIDRLQVDSLKIFPGDIVFHLLSTTFSISNSTFVDVNCTSFIDTIFQVRLESTFSTNVLSVSNTQC